MKRDVVLEIKPAPKGAWISYNGVSVGIAIRDSQMLYVNHESQQGQLMYLWDYRTLIERILTPMKLRIKDVSPGSIAEIVALHDRLVRENLPPVVQVLLKAQIRAGFRQYAPINAEIAAQLNINIIKDVQQWKVAGAILRNVLSFKHESAAANKATSYLEKIQNPMLEWIESLSDTGKAYKALSSSIMKGKAFRWIGKVPEGIQGIRNYHLERPLSSAVIRLLLALSDITGLDKAEKDAWAHIIQHSSAADIRYLFNLPQMKEQLNNSRNRASDVELLCYLRDGMRLEKDSEERRHNRRLDKPVSYAHLDLLGMYNRSYKAHEDEAQYRARQREVDAENRRKTQKQWMQTKTATLPFRLPEFDEQSEGRFYFLDTVDAIHTEADRMGHCIASYSHEAVNGDCYLFHVDYKGQMASIEMSATGHIHQSKGPRNCQNTATEWGAKAISEWVRNWEQYRITEETENVET